MKSTSFNAFTSILSLALAASTVNACSTQGDTTVTFYGYPDNSPPGAGTAYNCGGRNNIAGGTGTYADPLTFATADGEFQQCEIIYLPYLKKYLRYEDSCEQCTTDWSSGKAHIDVWTGSNSSNGGQNQIDCEDSLTPDAQSIVRSPPNNLDVDDSALFDGSCHTDHTYPGNAASCSGSGSGGSTPASSSTPPSSTPSGSGSGSSGSCEWAGHCAGATCSSDNDCSDVLTCQSGVCAQ